MRAVAQLLGLCLIWACLGMSASAAASPAADRPDHLRIALMPVRVSGELDEHWRAMLEARLLEGLERGQFEVIGTEATSNAAPQAETCDTPDCLAAVARETRADAVLVWRIEGESRYYTVDLELVGKDGSIEITSSETCEVCGMAEVGDLIGHQAAALRSKLEAGALAPPVLRLTSDPPGATIVIDGQALGEGPVEHVVEPGVRKIVASHPGYVTEERTVTAVTGVHQTVHLVLQPAPALEPGEVRRRAPWGWAAFGVGLAVAGAGVPLIVLDSRPYRGRCSGNDVDLSGRCKYLYDTLTAGVALAVTGVVLVATGVAIVAAARRKNKRRARASVRPNAFDLEIRF